MKTKYSKGTPLGGYGKPRNENRLRRFKDHAAAFGRNVFGEEKDEGDLIKPDEARLSNAPQRIMQAPKRAMRNLRRLMPKKKTAHKKT
mgnify:FL=1